MTQAAGGFRQQPTRALYALLAASVAAFVAYGSFVPLRFNRLALDEAVARFSELPFRAISPSGNVDFATNVLLQVPLGYFLMAALRTDRRKNFVEILTALFLLPVCWAFAFAVEFGQLFFSGRTPASSDIVAQSIGALVGILIWLWIGRAVTEWVRHFRQENEASALVQNVLFAYCVGLCVAQVLPLDLTVDPGQLARKFRNGGVVLIPFSYEHESIVLMLWDYVWDVVMHVPLGAAATLLWTGTRGYRETGRAFVLGALFVAAVELVQVLVMSRYADVTDLFTGGLGLFIGIRLASLHQRAATSTRSRREPRSITAFVALVAWIIALLVFHWYPFDFTFDREHLRISLDQLKAVPFQTHYVSSVYTATTQVLRKSLLAVPIGVFVRLMWRDSRPFVARIRVFVVAVLGFGLLFMMELGQAALPGRIPDITEVFVGDAGILTGLWLTGRLLGARQAQTPQPAGSREAKPAETPS